MSQEGPTSSPPPAASPSLQEWTVRLDLARWSGGLLAVVGVVVGVLMVLKRREAPCADGTYFPEGTTDFQCYVHPQAMQGVGMIVLSLLLGIVLLLACAIATRLHLLPSSPPVEPGHASDDEAPGTGDDRASGTT